MGSPRLLKLINGFHQVKCVIVVEQSKKICNYQTDGMFVIVDTKMIEIIMQR